MHHNRGMTTKPPTHLPRPLPGNSRLFAIVAVFALLGPALGGLAVSASLAAFAALPMLADARWLAAGRTFLTVTLFGTAFGLPIAYVVGLLPAAAVGLAVALWDRRTGRLSWPIAAGASLLPWLFIALRTGGDIVTDDEGTQVAQLALLVGHLAAAIACWWLARAILGRSPPPG